MKTINENDTIAKAIAKAKRNTSLPESLVDAVIDQLGGGEDAIQSMGDIAWHGMNGGFTGFIYYSDTVAFFKANRADITQAAKDMARDLGENVMDMIAGFRCLTDDDETRESIGRCVYGGKLTDDDDTVANALAWFAAEEVARAFDS